MYQSSMVAATASLEFESIWYKKIQVRLCSHFPLQSSVQPQGDAGSNPVIDSAQ